MYLTKGIFLTLATQKFESHLTVIINQWINSQSLSMHGSNTRFLLSSNDEDVIILTYLRTIKLSFKV